MISQREYFDLICMIKEKMNWGCIIEAYLSFWYQHR
jgi:hypothetical protein